MTQLLEKLSDPDYILSEKCTLSSMLGELDPQFLPWKRWRCDEATALEIAAQALNERRYEVSQILAISKRTLEILHTMKKNPANCGEGYAQLNVANQEMQPYQKTFQLVLAIMPDAVFRRDWFDLWSEKAVGLEKHKLGIAQNLDYVGGAIRACGKMEGILSEAQGRITKQIEAAKHELPWPAEVMGS